MEKNITNNLGISDEDFYSLIEKTIWKNLGLDDERIDSIFLKRKEEKDFLKSVTKEKLTNKEIFMKHNYITRELHVNIEGKDYLLEVVRIKSLKITYTNGKVKIYRYGDINFEYHHEIDMQTSIEWYEPTVVTDLEEYGVECVLNVCKLIELGCKVELIDYDI